MADEETVFVYHDGAYIKDTVLIEMAKNAGSIGFAEHYLCSLLYHALTHKMGKIVEVVNEIRKSYQLKPYPLPNETPASSNNMPSYNTRKETDADTAREKYKRMTDGQRQKAVRDGLTLLKKNHEKLFDKSSCWIGIYLVIRDRLDGKIKQKSFTAFAENCTPKDWNGKLCISKSTMSNLSRSISYEDRGVAYYDMQNNPWDDLCEEFWKELLNVILTGK